MTGLGIGIMILLGGIIILFFVVVFVMGTYNRLAGLRNRYKNAYAQIDVQLKRRYDLISNLAEIAKGCIQPERESSENVVKARNVAYTASQTAAANPGNVNAMKSLGSSETDLADTLRRLRVLSEAHPDLKANQNMMQLTEELTSTENKISAAGRAYNDSVMTYNTARQGFPANMIARLFNFARAESFVIDKPEQKEASKRRF